MKRYSFGAPVHNSIRTWANSAQGVRWLQSTLTMQQQCAFAGLGARASYGWNTTSTSVREGRRYYGSTPILKAHKVPPTTTAASDSASAGSGNSGAPRSTRTEGSGAGSGAGPKSDQHDGTPFWGSISRFWKRNWFTLTLPILLVFCSNWSEVFKDKGLLGMERFKDASVVGIFLCAGLAIPLGQMRSVALNWKLNIFSQSFGFFATPALMLCLLPVLRDVLKFPEPICTGFLILSALPASIGAPIALTRVAGGDGAVTLLNSVVSNLLGVVITPLVVVWLTGMHASIDEWAIIDKLTRVVAIPSLIGIALRHYVPLVGKFDPQWKLLQPLILLGLLANVFSNAFVSAQSGAGSKISSLTFSEIIGIAMAFNFSLIALLYACTMALRFSNGTSAAVIMTMSQKTAAMGVPLISVMFAGDPNLALLTAPLLCYHPVSAVFGGGIAALLRKRLKL